MRRTTGLHRERGRPQRLPRDLTAEEVRAVVVRRERTRRSGRHRAVRGRGALGSSRGARYFPGMTLDFTPVAGRRPAARARRPARASRAARASRTSSPASTGRWAPSSDTSRRCSRTGRTRSTGARKRLASTRSNRPSPKSTASASTSCTRARRNPTRCRCSSRTAGPVRSRSSSTCSARCRTRARTAAIPPTRSTWSRRRCRATGSPVRRSSADGTRGAWPQAFTQIMADLGYDRYGAQGGDWGSIVSQNVADLDPEHVCGLHLNFITVPRPKDAPDPDAGGAAGPRRRRSRSARTGAGYQEIQGTKPQTVGYGLEDSPSGLCAWIVEKFTRVDRLRRRRRARVHEGPVAHQHHRVLGDRDRDVVGAPVLRDATGRTRRDPARRTSACPPAWRTTRARSPARRGRGPSTATTSPTGPSNPTAGTSPRCRCPTSSWPTSGSSSAPSADRGPAPRAPLYNVITSPPKPTLGVAMTDLDEAAQAVRGDDGRRSPTRPASRRGRARSRRRCTCERAAECPVVAQPERHRHAAADGRHPHRQPQPRRRAGQQVPRQQPQGDPARARRSRAHEVPAPARPGVHRTAHRAARAQHPQARQRVDRRLRRRRRGQRQPARGASRCRRRSSSRSSGSRSTTSTTSCGSRT